MTLAGKESQLEADLSSQIQCGKRDSGSWNSLLQTDTRWSCKWTGGKSLSVRGQTDTGRGSCSRPQESQETLPSSSFRTEAKGRTQRAADVFESPANYGRRRSLLSPKPSCGSSLDKDTKLF